MTYRSFQILEEVVADRRALALWAFLSVAWLLPGIVDSPSVPFSDVLLSVALALVIPALALDIAVWSGPFENLTYLAGENLPLLGPFFESSGIFVFFYLFAVVSVVVGDVVAGQWGSGAERSRLRWLVAGTFFAFSGLLFLQPLFEEIVGSAGFVFLDLAAGACAASVGGAILVIGRLQQ